MVYHRSRTNKVFHILLIGIACALLCNDSSSVDALLEPKAVDDLRETVSGILLPKTGAGIQMHPCILQAIEALLSAEQNGRNAREAILQCCFLVQL
jgi:hypothetical protein